MSDDQPTEPLPPANTVTLSRTKYVALMTMLVALFAFNILQAYSSYSIALPLLDDSHRQPKEKIVVPERIDLATGAELLEMLKRGGYVLYTRHFQTDHSKWHKDPIRHEHGERTLESYLDCDQQRRLTEWGRTRARHVGKILRDYQVPIGKVYSSPYCRARQGVEALLGRKPDVLDKQLVYRGGSFTFEKMARAILPYLGRKPAPGTNDLVMAHRPQMDEIGRIGEGEMWVFEPLGGTRFALVGKIRDHEWFESLVDLNFLGLARKKGGLFK